jgi:ring-1,2-phenylacetyl-CoA epoxidase subunit PaaE
MNMLGEELRRSYSICSSPHENELRIAIKKAPGGRFSTYAAESLRAAQTLEVLPPTGRFVLDLEEKNKKHYIAFAAGSGITPVISLIKTIFRQEPLSQVSLVYGNRTRSSVIFLEELEQLKNRYPQRFQLIHIFSRERTEAPVNEGRIDAAKCEQLFSHLIPLTPDAIFLLCGPAPMIFTVRDWLLQRGVDTHRIHYELFSDPGEHPVSAADLPAGETSDERSSSVSIRLDGVNYDLQVPYQGESILETAIRQGIDLPYACKAGVCATCRARLLEGKVRMDQNYALVEEELEAGFILTCQSHPTTPRVRIDFDDR